MTTVIMRPQDAAGWNTMPGWNVVADLTPPELINSRRVAALRKWLIVGLVIVLLVCVAGYGLAFYRNRQAEDDAGAAANNTTVLQEQIGRYSGITRMQTITQTTDGQVAQLLSQDVDVPALAARISAALPASMSIQNLAISFSPGGTGSSGSTASTPLNMSGFTEIGTITLNGSARTITDLPSFVDRLGAIPGLVSVLPQSDQTASGKGGSTQYSVTASMTNRLLSHHFSAGPTGGK